MLPRCINKPWKWLLADDKCSVAFKTQFDVGLALRQAWVGETPGNNRNVTLQFRRNAMHCKRGCCGPKFKML